MSLRDLVLDQYAPLSYKKPLGDVSGRGTPLINRGWMSERDRRRLSAYLVLTAYEKNSARKILELDGADACDLREYGDAALIVKKATAALLGRTQEIVVDGADQFDPDLGEIEQVDDQPEGEPADENAPTEEELRANAEAAQAVAMQEFLRDWAGKERLRAKLLEGERKCVHLGDIAYLVLPDTGKGRVRLSVLDPGWYFPVLPDGLFDDFPETLHFAWEIVEEGKPTLLRRLSFRLAPILPEMQTRATLRGRVTEPVFDEQGRPVPRAGDVFDEARQQITRQYPWEDEPSTVTCYMTDATWKLDVVKDMYDLSEQGATYATTVVDDQVVQVKDLDLRCDFIPVIHEPNTPAGSEHFGQSVLADVLQLLDDVMGTDTDSQAASATTGLPIIGTEGQRPTDSEKERKIAPGEVWYGGKLTTVDTSNGLRELRETAKDRRSTLSVNSRIPEAFIGRLKATEAPSGYALELGFTPLDEFVGEMRLTRDQKHPLILKFVQRFSMLHGWLPEGAKVLPATIELGQYLPTNLDAVIERVTALRKAEPPLISLETAVGMLLDAGLPIDDVAAEITRIQHKDYTGANTLADATNDVQAVRDLLGLEGQAPVVPQEVVDKVTQNLPPPGQLPAPTP